MNANPDRRDCNGVPRRVFAPHFLVSVSIVACVTACSESDSHAGAAGSSSAAGASANQTTSLTGGTPNASSAADAGGNDAAEGGTISSGGSQNGQSGGASAAGGTSSTRISAGGTAEIGGSKALGGTSGDPTSSGASSIGGSRTSAITPSTGGTHGSGGTKTSSGSAAVGGGTGSGGTPAIGGSSGDSGTKVSGGTPSSGGASSNGGSETDRCGRQMTVEIPSGYTKLAWHDEFDVDGAPSSSNWNYESGFVRNNELQWYQSKNAAVSDGQLVITGKRERVTNPNYSAGSSDWKKSRQYAEYTSTSMTTSGKQSWKFGRFEMCAKIPISSGMWPAWWTLGVSGEWPSNGEIDIMEFYKGKILANVACGTSEQWTAKWDSSTRAVDSAWAAKYHVWRMDWNSTQIDLYVDDSLMNSVTLSSMLNADGKSPFLQNAYMIVNLAIGGDNGGDPANTTFPQEYLIDYLRVFQ